MRLAVKATLGSLASVDGQTLALRDACVGKGRNAVAPNGQRSGAMSRGAWPSMHQTTPSPQE
jgi:hypothetical protein